MLWNMLVLLASFTMLRLYLWLGLAQMVIAVMQVAYTVLSHADAKSPHSLTPIQIGRFVAAIERRGANDGERATRHQANGTEVKYIRGGGQEEPLIQEVSHVQKSQASVADENTSDLDVEEILCDPVPKNDCHAAHACDVSSESEDNVPIHGAAISLPSHWASPPALDSMNMLRHDDGNFFVLQTCGDGACALSASAGPVHGSVRGGVA